MSAAVTEEKAAIEAAIIVQDGKVLLVQRRVSEGFRRVRAGGAAQPRQPQ